MVEGRLGGAFSFVSGRPIAKSLQLEGAELFEQILENIGSQARICRRLYDPHTGGYFLPARMEAERLTKEAIETYPRNYTRVRFDCIELPVADLLASLVLNSRSTLIIETGTSRGFSTCHLAAAARVVDRSAVVHTLDAKVGPNRFFEAETVGDNIRPTIGNSLDFPLDEVLGDRKIDFLFLDSLHSFVHLNRELALFGARLKLGGLITMHDTMCYDGLALLVMQMQRSGFFEAVNIPTHRTHGDKQRSCPGVTIFRKIRNFISDDLILPVTIPILETEAPFLNKRQIQRSLGPQSIDKTYRVDTEGPQDARTRHSESLLTPSG